jgi:opacity protein-like surface antigen
MTRKLALALTMGMGCLCATGASAAELAEASGTAAEIPATEAADASVYGVAASSLAAAQTTGSGGSGWEFAITPYLWASGAKAKIETPQGENIKVDESFIDILDDLKFAMMGAFEAKHGRFVMVHDLMFLSLGSSADGNIGPIPIEADVDEKLLTTTHLFGYRVVDNGPMFVDVFAGGRLTSIKVDVDINLPLVSIERDSKKTEFGPVIASRVRFPFSDKWGVGIYGDVGGFGVGADISWQLLGTVQYDISDRWRLSAGWRHFYAKQTKNDFDVHIKLDGPILGVTYRF